MDASRKPHSIRAPQRGSTFGRVLVGIDGTEPGFEACRQAAVLAAPDAAIEAVAVVHLAEAVAVGFDAPRVAERLERALGSVSERPTRRLARCSSSGRAGAGEPVAQRGARPEQGEVAVVADRGGRGHERPGRRPGKAAADADPPRAVLEVDREWQLGRAREHLRVEDNLVEGHVPVEPPEREREPGARRRERPEAVRGKHLRRTRVPRVRDHERLAPVQDGERGRSLRLTRQSRDLRDHAVHLEDLGVLAVHVDAVRAREVADVLRVRVAAVVLRRVALERGHLPLDVALLEGTYHWYEKSKLFQGIS